MRIRIKQTRENIARWWKNERLNFYEMDFEKLKIITLEKSREKTDGRLLRRVRFLGFDDARVLSILTDKYDRTLHGAKYTSRLNALRDLYERAFVLDIIVAAYYLAELGDADGIITLQDFGFRYDINTESRIKREKTDLDISRAEFSRMYGIDESEADESNDGGFYSVVANVEHHIGRNLDIERMTVARWVAYVKHAQTRQGKETTKKI